MKKKLLLTVLIVIAVATPFILPLVGKADPPPGRCSHVVAWIDGGGEVGCLPFYTCSNPDAWPLSTKCYVHMGTPDAPNPCN